MLARLRASPGLYLSLLLIALLFAVPVGLRIAGWFAGPASDRPVCGRTVC